MHKINRFILTFKLFWAQALEDDISIIYWFVRCRPQTLSMTFENQKRL